MLKTKIKASSITNLTDARYFAAWDVAWLGFCLEPNTLDFVKPIEVAAIKEWVEGPKIVGEFGLQTAEEIRSLVNDLDLDAVQLPMLIPEGVLAGLDGVPVIQEIVIEEGQPLEGQVMPLVRAREAYVSVFLLNFEANRIPYATLGTQNQDYLQELCSKHNILLSIAVQTSKIDDLLKHIQPLGLQVRGGDEEKVGFKSFDDLDDLFEALESFPD